MCKHVAAVLYGVGARLDDEPELLFRLRKVDEKELLAGAAVGLPVTRKRPRSGKILDAADISGIFGIDFEDNSAREPVEVTSGNKKRTRRAKPSRKKRS